MPATIRAHGLTELNRAFSAMSKEMGRDLRYELRLAGDVVRGDAANRLAELDPNVAAKLRVKVAGGTRGPIRVFVDNPLRKVDSKHQDWGPTQLRVALEPALDAKRHEVKEMVEGVVDALGDRYF